MFKRRLALLFGNFSWNQPPWLKRSIVRIRAHRFISSVTVIVLLAVDAGYGIYLEAYGVQHGLDTTTSRGIPVY